MDKSIIILRTEGVTAFYELKQFNWYSLENG